MAGQDLFNYLLNYRTSTRSYKLNKLIITYHKVSRLFLVFIPYVQQKIILLTCKKEILRETLG